jgi:transposase
MGRKCVEVKTLHGFTISDLQKKVKESTSKYKRNVLTAIIMRFNGISTTDIMKTLGVSRPTVTKYINDWNSNPEESITDYRGGNVPSKLTDEIVDDIKYILLHKKPSDFGYPKNNWNSSLLSLYIEDNYGHKMD